MALDTKTNSYVQQLIDTGADAMQNLYYVEFKGGAFGENSVGISVRNQEFQAPTFTQNKNEFHYLTTSVSMPGAQISGTKELTFTLRVDSYYDVYKKLLAQQSYTMIGNDGWANNKVPSIDTEKSFTISVRAYKGDKEAQNPDYDTEYTELYNFTYCWIKNIEGLTYSYDNSNPLTVKVTVGFYDYKDPAGLLK